MSFEPRRHPNDSIFGALGVALVSGGVLLVPGIVLTLLNPFDGGKNLPVLALCGMAAIGAASAVSALGSRKAERIRDETVEERTLHDVPEGWQMRRSAFDRDVIWVRPPAELDEPVGLVWYEVRAVSDPDSFRLCILPIRREAGSVSEIPRVFAEYSHEVAEADRAKRDFDQTG